MKTDEIMELFRQFESIANDYEGVECWSARELSKLLGYTQRRCQEAASRFRSELFRSSDQACRAHSETQT